MSQITRHTPDHRVAVRLLMFVATLLALLFVLDAWCVHFSWVHLDAGKDAGRRGDWETVRLEWESAASRPAPFNPYAVEAMRLLVGMERRLEDEGRFAEALRVCFSIQGIVGATSGYWSYYSGEGGYISGRIPELARHMGVAIAPERFFLYRPVRGWAAHLAVGSFVLWVASTLAAITGASGRRRVRMGWVAVVTFLLWLLFLRFA